MTLPINPLDHPDAEVTRSYFCQLTGRSKISAYRHERIDPLWPKPVLRGGRVFYKAVDCKRYLTLHLVLDETGSRMSLATIRRRFWNARKAAGITYQLRDIRAKAGSDVDSIRSAQKLLGHSNESTTTAYRRDRVGEVAQPVMRDIKSNR